MLNVEIFHEAVKSSSLERSPSGVSCYFVKINDTHGIKVYYSKDDRDRAFARQEKMAKHGYAPPVGVSFDIKHNYNGYSYDDNCYCYVTEIAEVCVERVKGVYESWEDWHDKCAAYKVKYPSFDDDLDELIINMRAVGFDMSDVHMANFGRYNDKLVCIDFGE